MEDDLNGRQPIWKTTSMEDNLHGRPKKLSQKQCLPRIGLKCKDGMPHFCLEKD